MTNPVERSGFFVVLDRQKVTIVLELKTNWLKIVSGIHFDIAIIENIPYRWNLFQRKH